MAATIKDVAQLANVSAITVSRVINHHPSVRPETRSRVVAAIRKLDYHPNRSARTLAARRSRCLGVVIPKAAHFLFENPFFSSILKGVTEQTEARGYRVILSTIDDIENDCLRLYQERFIDGAIILSAGRGVERGVIALLGEGAPFVMTTAWLTDLALNYVEVDNCAGARQAVRHLIERGNRRIAFINGSTDLPNCRDRLRGFREVMDAAGLYDEALVVETEFTEEAGYTATQKLLAREAFDALFAAADITAVAAALAIRDAKLNIPGDISVVGFDGIPISRYVYPPLTTVQQPAYAKGFLAAKAMIDILEGKKEPPVQIVLPPRLVVRQST